MTDMDRLEKIEHALDQLFRQNVALMEGLDRLYREGGTRLSGMEDEGSDRLEHIEKLLETINLRLAARP